MNFTFPLWVSVLNVKEKVYFSKSLSPIEVWPAAKTWIYLSTEDGVFIYELRLDMALNKKKYDR